MVSLVNVFEENVTAPLVEFITASEPSLLYIEKVHPVSIEPPL